MLDGVIIKGIGGFYYVNTGQGLYECRARGIFRKEKQKPLVGDFVGIQILDEKNKKGSLDKIYPRKKELIRPRVSNVDHAVIVFAAKSPDINLDLLDRFLILVEEQGLDITICFNKIDLDLDKNYLEYCELYSDAGYRVLPVSADRQIGIERLREVLMGKISVFAGPSGVGKSSLINAVVPNFSLQTGAVSEKIARGRHTTRHAELMQFAPNSFIVDSPGFTSLYLDHIKKEDLPYYFKEFHAVEGVCRFSGCSHTHEPDCAVKAQVGQTISKKRYERYLAIYQELAEKEEKKYD